MATKSVITKIRRKKMAEASHTTGTVAKITHIALGSGGVNADGTVIVPLAENVALKKEVVRKPYTSSTKTSDTSYEYTIKDSVTRMRRKLKKFRKLMDAGEMSFDDVRCAYASWKGGVSHYDSYNVVKSMDKLFDELFIHPFIGGGHRDEQNNNEQK